MKLVIYRTPVQSNRVNIFSGKVLIISWSMQLRMTKDIVLMRF
ncbi:hypothetical protein EC841_103417 [Raoultella ornithinolytica]|uniref:Uncharacterized protein n=1 Tax=Raoultella ornithinolytica TaxID=54291 RepID=A0ABD7QKM2_RAOOR|nr:hypothetical protein EC841_103417 [Raoultella ornithinolytica]